MNNIWYYSIGVFTVVLIAGCALNLYRRHFIFQLAGIAFLFTFVIFRFADSVQNNYEITARFFYMETFPALMGISACLISMVLGFWLFPLIRSKIQG